MKSHRQELWPESERIEVGIGPDGYPLDYDSEDHRKLEELQASELAKS